jgi:hypothetical protein
MTAAPFRLLKRLKGERTPSPAEQPSREWKQNSVREAIAQDWSMLAMNNLTSEQRKAVRDHLGMNIAALRELTGQASIK